MSSRHDYRRRDRSWERDDRDKGRDRERERDRDRDRYIAPQEQSLPQPETIRHVLPIHTFLQPLNCATDRRDYGRDRDEDRRDRDSRDSRRRDERDRRDAPRRDVEKDRDRYDRDKKDGEKSQDAEHETEKVTERGALVDSESRETVKASQSHAISSISSPHVHADVGEPEEGEAMEAVNEDDEAMMAMMGLTRFRIHEGSACHRKSRGFHQCQETTNMETIYEQAWRIQ
ncbi:hypothetical protein F5888DRAFT_1799932 [Russula emetica]|nr:hypothetical protein F5888DRAFT_1799932 [Russula emetica]